VQPEKAGVPARANPAPAAAHPPQLFRKKRRENPLEHLRQGELEVDPKFLIFSPGRPSPRRRNQSGIGNPKSGFRFSKIDRSVFSG
jgi:hypothetical protein